jgi:hypothetical protein
MADLIIPIEAIPAQVEIRADQVILANNLDAVGPPGTPGKYRVVIDVQHETQTADGQMIVRRRGRSVVIDPMEHATTEIETPLGTMTVGAICACFIAAVDHFKGGITE